MIEQWKSYLGTRVIYLAYFISILVLFCFSLSAIRIHYTGQPYYLFLVKNLFLALLPWVGVETASLLQRKQASNIFVYLFIGLTVLFLPNAPYLITDLCHLHWSSQTNLLWFDVLLIVTYSITGVVGFYATLFELENLIEQYIGKLGTRFIVIILLFLTGFGIYLGRVLRFNSWDVWAAPWSLLEVIGMRLFNPMAHPRTWGVTLGYSCLFLLGFYGLKLWKYLLLQAIPLGESLEEIPVFSNK